VTQQFKVGTAPILEFYPPEGLIDASATLRLSADDGTLWDGSPETIAQASSPSTVTTATANRGDESVAVASIASFVVGRRYLIVRANGIVFEMTLRAKVTGLLTFEQGFSDGLAVGDTIRDWALRRTLTTDETASVSRWNLAEWQYSKDGQICVHEHRFDCVNRPFGFAITEQDLREKAPDWDEFRGRLPRWKHCIPEAHRTVDRILRGGSLYPDRIALRDLLKSAVLNATLHLIHRSAGSVLATQYLDDMSKDLSNIQQSKNRYDADDSGNSSASDSSMIPAIGHVMPRI
jgi:hypothetical protein